MADDSSLQELVLGYSHQVGGLVEPPAFGIHEVLLPDEIAARWGVDSLQKFAFSPEVSPDAFITYTSPLVGTMIEEIRQQTANGLFFINAVRLGKPGLYAAIEKSLNLPNAKLFPVTGAVERQRLYHLVRFNFKASLIADEKRELILPVWMNAQGGYPVNGAEIENLAILENQIEMGHLEAAEPAWISGAVLSPMVLKSLLERARQAAQIALGPNLTGLQKRLQRFFELDHARLTEYYADLIKDTEKRLRNAEEERRPVLESKLKAIQLEQKLKLADVEEKYHLRVELELINLAVIVQPKLDLRVEIRKRTKSVQKLVVWDPLRHIVEPLCCDVCGQARPGEALHLCDEGHLAHTNCLAPQCVECKRTYCLSCGDKVQTCVVCDRPVCVHSLVRCTECQRITCHEHVNACHAVDGAPTRKQAGKSELPAAAPEVKKETSAKSTESAEKKTTRNARQPARKREAATHSVTPGGSMDVFCNTTDGSITAFVLVRKKRIAARHWEMIETGLSCECQCEKAPHCEFDGLVYRPAPDLQLEAQMNKLLGKFIAEYGVVKTKIHYFQIRQGQSFEEKKLKLPSQWRDSEALEQARQKFDQLPNRKLSK